MLRLSIGVVIQQSGKLLAVEVGRRKLFARQHVARARTMYREVFMRRVVIWSLALAATGALVMSSNAHAQNLARQENYQKALQEKLDAKVEEMMEAKVKEMTEAKIEEVTGTKVEEMTEAKAEEMREAYGEKIPRAERWTCEVRMQESADYPGKVDAEISVKMPIDEFKEFAPIALLEAVAVPHSFPTGKIYIRETTTRRVGSIDYRAADPLAGKYLTGRPDAVEDAIAEMNRAMTWH